MKKLYDEWSESYDDEIGGQGYATPRRCAAALADAVEDLDAPILDFGCGTGMSGQALAASGFAVIDGCDISEKMLEVARGKGIYRRIWCASASDPISFQPGSYRNIAAIGVISVGAAPIGILDNLFAALPGGGAIVFSFNEHTLQDPAYEYRVYEYVDTAAAHLLFREHGDHLPGIGMQSTVYVLQKQ